MTAQDVKNANGEILVGTLKRIVLIVVIIAGVFYCSDRYAEDIGRAFGAVSR